MDEKLSIINVINIYLIRSPVNDRVEHGVNDGKHLGDAGEVILEGSEAILQGSDPLLYVQEEPETYAWVNPINKLISY